jgi:hypothetical protein
MRLTVSLTIDLTLKVLAWPAALVPCAVPTRATPTCAAAGEQSSRDAPAAAPARRATDLLPTGRGRCRECLRHREVLPHKGFI